MLGATLRVADLATCPELEGETLSILRKAASVLGTTAIRNAVTLGGNIVHVVPWSDLPAPLLALDASVALRGKESRILPVTEFFRRHPIQIIAPDKILTEVRIPRPPSNYAGAFLKFARTPGDFSTLNLACVLALRDERIAHCRVAVSAATPPHGGSSRWRSSCGKKKHPRSSLLKQDAWRKSP